MNINNLMPMNFSRESFYIGVDSGGTKCQLLIASSDRKQICEKTFKGIHYSISGARVFAEAVSDYINKSLKSSGKSLRDCKCICLGIAGAREESDRTKLKNNLTKLLSFKNIIVTTDAMTALYGAFDGNDGIILISGTGSVLYGYTGGKIIRIGGWGRIIGDEGSGYWIGKRALNLIAKEYDCNPDNKSLLTKKIAKEFGINKSNLNQKVFQKNFQIQNIAPLVIHCAENNCKLSLKIINEAVEGLIYHIKSFLSVSRIRKKIKIAFIGSIVENKNILSDNLKKEIGKLNLIKVVVKNHSASYGAVLIASEQSSITKKI